MSDVATSRLHHSATPSAVGTRHRSIGAAYVTRDGVGLTVLATGTMITAHRQAAALPTHTGTAAVRVHSPTAKPLDPNILLTAVARTRPVAPVHEAQIAVGSDGTPAGATAPQGS